MIFSSPPFLVFFPLVLAVFWATRGLGFTRLSLDILTIASIVYYAWWDLWYVPLIAGTVIFNYSAGRLLRHRRNSGKSTGLLLAISVVINLAPLIYFKYTGFILDQFQPILGPIGSSFDFLLPLGISFYTFQQIAYLVDVVRGKPDEPSFRNYALFVLFFPQLIAGPIVHHNEVMEQFLKGPRRPWINLALGLTIFIVGLTKKLVFADGFAAYANPVFDAANNGIYPSPTDAWIASASYVFQLYFDFSGYSDMAIGIARCFGVTLPINFNSPYKAATVSEFWRRWHITLVRFVRSYLFQPLALTLGRWSANRGFPRRIHYFLSSMGPTLLTFTVIGLWHGAGWTFIVFGLIHGAIVNFEQSFGFAKKMRRPELIWRLFALLWVPFILLTTFVVFRASDLSTAGVLLQSMFGFTPSKWQLPSVEWSAMALIATVIVRVAPNIYQLTRHYKPVLIASDAPPLERLSPRWPSWRPTPIAAILVGLMLAFSILQMARGVVEFIYFEF